MILRYIRKLLSWQPKPRMQSQLANWQPAKRQRLRSMKPWGICFHTSGRGIIARAERQGVAPIVLALKWYRAKEQSGVHYVIDHDGTIYQMLADDRRGAHIGISAKERRAYLSGRWVREVSAKASTKAAMLWRLRWPSIVSPQHLYPTRSPNSCYVGVEMLPLAAEDVGSDGLWFTQAQHEAAGALARDLAVRHGWPLGWENSPRLVGHEDVDAYARWDKRGGWDPGAMRDGPRWDWGLVLERICRGWSTMAENSSTIRSVVTLEVTRCGAYPRGSDEDARPTRVLNAESAAVGIRRVVQNKGRMCGSSRS